MSRTIAMTAGGGMLAMLGGTFAITLVGQGPDCGVVSKGPHLSGDALALTSEAAEVVELHDLTKVPALIYFGYTFCPDVCPLDAARNAAAVDIMADQGIAVTPIFVTIDPARDTPARLVDYTANFHPDMIGLTGTTDQIAVAAAQFGAFYQRIDDDPDYYLMQHSTRTYLLRPDTTELVTFGRTATPDEVARQTVCLLVEV